jgi:hypothetical protein
MRCAQQRTLAGLATVDMHLCLHAMCTAALLLAWPQWTCTSACTRCAQQRTISQPSHVPASTLASSGRISHQWEQQPSRSEPRPAMPRSMPHLTSCHAWDACSDRIFTVHAAQRVIAIAGTHSKEQLWAQEEPAQRRAHVVKTKINACADRDRQRQRDRESVPPRMQRWSHSRDACHALMQRASDSLDIHDRIPCTLTRVYSQCVAYLRLLVRADCAGPSRG